MKLEEYLSKKPLYYKNIDYKKMPKIFSGISSFFKLPKTVHIIGTNGKGSTGRFLAKICESNGLKVGHYTSPHILSFNERIYINGQNIDNKTLKSLHEELQIILKSLHEELSYFEYTTLLAFLAFKDCDIVLLEAGLGGEFDATNVVPKILSIVTPIGLDHQDFLGNTIEQITKTKLNSVNNCAIIATQESSLAVKVIKMRESELCQEFIYVDKNCVPKEVKEYSKKYNLPLFLEENFFTAYCAGKFLGLNIDITKTEQLDLNGRFQKVAKNITVDVGHNPLAASSVLKNFYNKKITLIYNSYVDKDFKTVLKTLQPIIKNVELLEIKNSQREDATNEIKDFLDQLNIEHKSFTKVENENEYLVFGSFGVVENFMKEVYEK